CRRGRADHIRSERTFRKWVDANEVQCASCAPDVRVHNWRNVMHSLLNAQPHVNVLVDAGGTSSNLMRCGADDRAGRDFKRALRALYREVYRYNDRAAERDSDERGSELQRLAEQMR